MKPIKLVISAFGPYKTKVEIDFKKIGNDGVFLITGDTGSGKTTIFDAISFALFGEASGSRRESSSFRSDFASDDINTFVELEFEHKGCFYKIERVPKYTRKKKRGNGVTSVLGEATLVYLDTVITGEKNVTEKCVEILGINSSQFKQISMIAQGEFLELLLSKPKDRASIFRHIFNTDIYKRISDNLKTKYLAKKREYEDIGITTLGYIQGVQLNSGLIGEESTEKVLELLDREISVDSELEKTLELEKSSLFEESKKIIEIISEGKIINDSIINLNKANIELSELLERESLIKDKERLILKNREIWTVIIPNYDEFIKLKKDLVLKKQSLKDSERKYFLIMNDYKVIFDKYKKLPDKENKIKQYNEELINLKNSMDLFLEIDDLNRELFDVNKRIEYCWLLSKLDILTKVKSFKNKQLELDKLREQLIREKEEYKRLNNLYVEHYDLFLSAQAGILASDLKDGFACPVCGSFNHPCLAVLVDDVLSKTELDKEKEELDSKYLNLEKLRDELVLKEKDVDNLKREVLDIDEAGLLNEIEVLQAKYKKEEYNISREEQLVLENRYQQICAILDEKKKKISGDIAKEEVSEKIDILTASICDMEKDIDITRKDYEEISIQKTGIMSLIEVLKKDILKLENDVFLASKKYVDSYLNLGYEKEDSYLDIKMSREELLETESVVKKYNDNLVVVKSNIASLKKVINGRAMIELDSFELQLKDINERLDGVSASLKIINNKLSNNKKVYSQLKSVSDKTTKLEHEVMIYKDLSDTANGTITGKIKLEFEQYVQASYFDRVLVSANKRFSSMTEDRYQLLRKEEAVKISDKLGLELEVMDYYTGKRRDVKSLSGGESFKAALSLALGMSDTIQEFSGGIVVEALFIDEGFGSLDSESLEQAMNAIMMLSQGDKMIGIISHVNELKNRIDKKIVVKKSNSGSTVSLVV